MAYTYIFTDRHYTEEAGILATNILTDTSLSVDVEVFDGKCRIISNSDLTAQNVKDIATSISTTQVTLEGDTLPTVTKKNLIRSMLLVRML